MMELMGGSGDGGGMNHASLGAQPKDRDHAVQESGAAREIRAAAGAVKMRRPSLK
jgi:hypothetical protein